MRLRFSPLVRERSHTLRRVLLLLFSAIALGTGIATLACGPDFPNRFLVVGNSELLAAPRIRFAEELSRLLPTTTRFAAVVPKDRRDVYRQSRQVAEAQLVEALTQGGTDATRLEAIIVEYRTLREAIGRHARAQSVWRSQRARGRTVDPGPPRLEVVEVPSGLPTEFSIYLRGAISEAQGDTADARAEWQALLVLPVEQRSRRSVWAAYRLGRSHVDDNADEAARWFALARELAEGGFLDGLGLASASLGWEARAELNRGRFDRAARLYLEQWGSGDERAIESLWITTRTFVEGGTRTLQVAAADPLTRALTNAYLVSRMRSSVRNSATDPDPKAWLQALEEAQLEEVPGAFGFAWLAYQSGEWDSAQRWIDRGDGDAARVRWLQAKLWLRTGRVKEATDLLAGICHSFEVADGSSDALGDEPHDLLSEPARALGELATLRLATRHYEESLRLLLRGGHWLDAAYVAERVLTSDELLRFVDEGYPRSEEPSRDASSLSTDRWELLSGAPSEAALTRGLRALLGRRLAREGRLSVAMDYLPGPVAEKLRDYRATLQAGREPTRPLDERAASLWECAKITRAFGISLFGTEESPDWAALGGGNYEMDSLAEARARDAPEQLAPASFDERDRARRHRVDLAKRWHYRYLAADLAWEAAELMPDQTDETAQLLREAGSWLMVKDPPAADRFYKALVRRCGKTDLGREADRLRWFPRAPE